MQATSTLFGFPSVELCALPTLKGAGLAI